VTNIFLLDGGWLCGNITGHPSSFISSTSSSTSSSHFISILGDVPPLRQMVARQPVKKKFEKEKKIFTYCIGFHALFFL
jgi:hypothetical protein